MRYFSFCFSNVCLERELVGNGGLLLQKKRRGAGSVSKASPRRRLGVQADPARLGLQWRLVA